MTLIDLGQSDHSIRTPVDAVLASTYLTFGYVPASGRSRRERPAHPTRVADAEALIDALVDRIPRDDAMGLLLDGSIASAILAALVPADTPCYTIVPVVPGTGELGRVAAEQAVHWGHPHLAVGISWSDHELYGRVLMARRGAPVHPSEVAIHLAGQVADADGISTLVTGSGASGIFGGAAALLAKDWTFEEFVRRYQVIDPADHLTDPVALDEIFERHRVGLEIDAVGFLRDVHTDAVIDGHAHALSSAGSTMVSPYVDLVPAQQIDLARIRAGEPAPMLVDAYRMLYDVRELPRPVPDPHRAFDTWLAGWSGPRPRPGMRDDNLAAVTASTGMRRWILWSLATHLELVDKRAADLADSRRS